MNDTPLNENNRSGVVRTSLVPARMVLEKNVEVMERDAEIARLTARIDELERKSAHLKRCWFLAMGYSDIPDESTEQVLTRKVAEQRTAMDAMERKAARWDECEQRASFIEQSAGLFHWRIRTGCGVSTFAAAIDAAIEQREQEAN